MVARERCVSRPKRKLVATTQVGWLPINIVHAPQEPNTLGRWNYANATIEMAPNIGHPGGKLDVVIHELMHAACDVLGLTLRHDKLNTLATAVAQGLMSMRKVRRRRK